jgi:hypothetical protein
LIIPHDALIPHGQLLRVWKFAKDEKVRNLQKSSIIVDEVFDVVASVSERA